jgi:D-alanyl-D-alanine carboxypeptidase
MKTSGFGGTEAGRVAGRLPRRDVLRAAAAASLSLVMPAMLGGSPPAPPAGSGHDPADERRQSLQEALDSLVGGYDDPAERSVAALGLVRGRRLDWRGAAGYADRGSRRPARAGLDYRYRIGSASKTFTATVVLQLVGEGLLGLDDPIGRYLHGLVPGQDRLTIRHLLQMTSGLPDFLPLLLPSLAEHKSSYQEYQAATAHPIAPRDLISRAATNGLLFEPGAFFDYSTTNYLVLGLLVEQVTGRRYRDELHRRIIRPLGLHRTDLPDGPTLKEPYLRGYAHFDDRPEEWVDVSFRYEPGWAGGSIVSTMADLSRFFAALLAGGVLAPDLLTAMQSPSRAPSTGGTAPPGAPSGDSYGLGLQRTDQAPCGPMWGHGGDTHGYNNRTLSTPDGRARILAAKTGFPARSTQPGDSFELFMQAAFDAVCAH